MNYSYIFQKITEKQPVIKKPVIKKPVIKKPTCIHKLKSIGGSMNGRSDGKYASVYICSKCNRMGYIEDFADKG